MILTTTETTLNRHLRLHHGFTVDGLATLLQGGWTREQFAAHHDRLHADETAQHLDHRH